MERPNPASMNQSVQIRNFFGPYFPIFRLNTEIYSVNLRIKSDYRRIRTKKNSVFGRFSRSAAQVIRQMNNY